jgi:hypothetical protein
MTDEMMSLRTLLEKSSDRRLLEAARSEQLKVLDPVG